MGNERTELGGREGGKEGGESVGNEQRKKERKFHPVSLSLSFPFSTGKQRKQYHGVPGGRRREAERKEVEKDNNGKTA